MFFQDQLETNLLQLFVHPQNSEWFSIISGTMFEVNIVAGQKQAQLVTTVVLYKFPLSSTLSAPRPTAVPAFLLYIKCSQQIAFFTKFLTNAATSILVFRKE